jgi:hypothetical protein
LQEKKRRLEGKKKKNRHSSQLVLLGTFCSPLEHFSSLYNLLSPSTTIMLSSLTSWWFGGEDSAPSSSSSSPSSANSAKLTKAQALRSEIDVLRADASSASSKKACKTIARKYIELRKTLKTDESDTAGADQAMRDMCDYLASGALRIIDDTNLEEQVLGGTLGLRACKRLPSFPPFHQGSASLIRPLGVSLALALAPPFDPHNSPRKLCCSVARAALKPAQNWKESIARELKDTSYLVGVGGKKKARSRSGVRANARRCSCDPCAFTPPRWKVGW